MKGLVIFAAVWLALAFLILTVTGCGQASGSPTPAAQVSAAAP
jgi:outer membrane lipoprotein-sorting protein